MKHLFTDRPKLTFQEGDQVLLSRTDALGDLMVSLPLQERLLSRIPSLQIHWLVSPYTAPLLAGQPDIAGVHIRTDGQNLAGLFAQIKPQVVLNLGHRDQAVIVAARQAGVPIRVARARGISQILGATHRIWKGRYGTGRHEAMNVLDFLTPWGLAGGTPTAPRLVLTETERDQGERDLQAFSHPRLGIIFRGTGAGAHPGLDWWKAALSVFHGAGWAPIPLGPPELSELPATDLRGFMARLAACDAVLSPSSGPAHIAAALGLPAICLMGLRPNHSPDRWSPLGPLVQVIQYPGPEADLSGGMDRLDPAALLPHLLRQSPRRRSLAP